MNDYPLFTVGIVAYKNYKFIRYAVDSVFIQTYPNIELIISNDGSDDFDEIELISYINDNRTDNVVKVQINNNERNLGTCKHLNLVKSKAGGKYIMFLAADDALFNENSVHNIVKAFTENGDPLAVCGNCGMYDSDLRNCSEIVPRKEVVEKLTTLNPLEIYRALATDMFIPTAATTYNMKAFDILGDFDEHVFLVEDWAFFLKMLRNGYKPRYENTMVSKHRDGGICHGNESQVTDGNKNFHKDEMIIMEIELLPYKDVLGRSLHKGLCKRHVFLKNLWFQRYEFETASRAERFRFAAKGFPSLLSEALSRIRHTIVDCFLKNFYNTPFMLSTVFMIVLYYFADFKEILGSKTGNILHYICGIVAIGHIILVFLSIAMRLTYAFYIQLKYSLKTFLRR